MQAVEVAKTHEIMARFRPIAPKPELPANTALEPAPRSAIAALHLRTRPCRTRKRARPPAPTPLPIKHLRPNTTTTSLVHPVLTHHPLPTIPVERDLLQELQKPKVITPQPVRPVGSSITVLGCITLPNPYTTSSPASKKPAKVEEELELESLPAVVSDSKDKVRLVNLAYKEMVGQPVCPWLDSVGAGSSRRINGEVMLVRIEWASNGRKKTVDVPCDVVRLCCDSKDYSFAWRFHIN
ncbi:hypothetical protein DsansV1_C04g0041451 [Dioscorea sansibarensis]